MQVSPSPEELQLRELCEADPALAAAMASEFAEWEAIDRDRARLKAISQRLEGETAAARVRLANAYKQLDEWAGAPAGEITEARHRLASTIERLFLNGIERSEWPVAARAIARFAAQKASETLLASELLALPTAPAISPTRWDEVTAETIGEQFDAWLANLCSSFRQQGLEPERAEIEFERLYLAFLGCATRCAKADDAKRHLYAASESRRDAREVADCDQLEAELQALTTDLPPPPLETFLTASMPSHAPPAGEAQTAKALEPSGRNHLQS